MLCKKFILRLPSIHVARQLAPVGLASALVRPPQRLHKGLRMGNIETVLSSSCHTWAHGTVHVAHFS
jgi:hypothetical protein